MRGVIRVAVVPALLLLTTGCATKDWVRDMVGKREAEIDQRVGARVGSVETRLSEEAQRVTRVEGKVGETAQQLARVETQVGEVGETAKQAHTKAEAAHGRADEVDGRLTRLWSNRNKRNVVETLHVQFAFDKFDLNDAAQTALATIVKELKENPNLSVDLEGFTDPTGPHGYNVGLSQRRVESVRRYLIERGTELPRIHSVGMGPLSGGKSAEELAKQRRVTVKLMISPD